MTIQCAYSEEEEEVEEEAEEEEEEKDAEEEEEEDCGGTEGVQRGYDVNPTLLSPKEEGKYLDRRRILFPMFSVCSRSIPCCHD